MTNTDEPFELPDMTDVLEMAGVIDTLDENAMTAAAVEDEIIKYVDRIGNEVARLIHPESSVVGDDAVVLPTRNRLIHPESLALETPPLSGPPGSGFRRAWCLSSRRASYFRLTSGFAT